MAIIEKKHAEGPADVRGMETPLVRLMKEYKMLKRQFNDMEKQVDAMKARIAREARGFSRIETPDFVLDFYTSRKQMLSKEDWALLDKDFPGVAERAKTFRTKPWFQITKNKKPKAVTKHK